VKRRDFLFTSSIAAITLSLGAAPAPQEKKQYVARPVVAVMTAKSTISLVSVPSAA
jgi:hypothetical protein